MFGWETMERCAPIVGPELDVAVAEEPAVRRTVDRELQAAIEYKIATDGIDGVAVILDFVNAAIRRRRTVSCV